MSRGIDISVPSSVYSSRGSAASIPSSLHNPTSAKTTSAPSPSTPAAPPPPPPPQFEASDNKYVGQQAMIHFQNLQPDCSTLRVSLGYDGNKIVLTGSYYSPDSKAAGATRRQEVVAKEWGTPADEPRLTKGRLAKMVMPCVRIDNASDYDEITTHSYGPVAHCVMKSISLKKTSKLKIVVSATGKTSIAVNNFDLGGQSPLPGGGPCKLHEAALDHLRNSYPNIYPNLSEVDQEDLEAALKMDDLEEILDEEDEITQSYEEFTKKAAVQQAPPAMQTATPVEVAKKAPEEQGVSGIDDKQVKLPPRDTQLPPTAELKSTAEKEQEDMEDKTEEAPVCGPSALAKKKRSANEAGFGDESSSKRLKEHKQLEAPEVADENDSGPNAFDLLAAELGITNEEDSGPDAFDLLAQELGVSNENPAEDTATAVEVKVTNSKKRGLEETGSDDTKDQVAPKKSKKHNDGAKTKEVSEGTLFHLPPTSFGQQETSSPNPKQDARPKIAQKSIKRPAPPSASTSASTSPSGAGSTASEASTGRTTPQSLSGGATPLKLSHQPSGLDQKHGSGVTTHQPVIADRPDGELTFENSQDLIPNVAPDQASKMPASRIPVINKKPAKGQNTTRKVVEPAGKKTAAAKAAPNKQSVSHSAPDAKPSTWKARQEKATLPTDGEVRNACITNEWKPITLPDLKLWLESKNLSKTGKNKGELIGRAKAHMNEVFAAERRARGAAAVEARRNNQDVQRIANMTSGLDPSKRSSSNGNKR